MRDKGTIPNDRSTFVKTTMTSRSRCLFGSFSRLQLRSTKRPTNPHERMEPRSAWRSSHQKPLYDVKYRHFPGE
ncbi:unnamed protein product [Amoebophrya sp. A120]|nr:unnamed protein product [Amoebophrya sp. A120]|eukprot:GSA120T00000037001.1